MLINISFFSKELEDRKYRIAVFFDNSSGSLFQHTRDILIESTTCDMAACMDLHARLSDALQRFYIDSGRCDQCRSQSCSKLFIISIQRLFCHVKYFTYKRKSITVNSCGSHTDQDISWFQCLSCKKIFLSTTPTANPARSYSSSGISPGCSAVSPPIRAASDCTQPSATPFTISAIFSG